MLLRITLAALLAAAAAGWATPSKPVDEDFSGSTFPPTGWSCTGSSSSGSWSWTDGGGCARGNISTDPFGQAETSLFTYAFRVSGGTKVEVEFNYKANGFPDAQKYVRLGGWSKTLPYTLNHEWTPFAIETTPSSSGDYKLEFFMKLSGGSHSMSGVWYLDDVEVKLQNTAVAPTSLGRLRALFR